MNESDRENFARTMFALAQLKGVAVDATRVNAYFKRLQSYRLSQIEAACDLIIREDEGTYFPQLATIVGLIDGSGADRALDAWGQMLSDLSRGSPVRDADARDALETVYGPFAPGAIKIEQLLYMRRPWTDRYERLNRPAMLRPLKMKELAPPTVKALPAKAQNMLDNTTRSKILDYNAQRMEKLCKEKGIQ